LQKGVANQYKGNIPSGLARQAEGEYFKQIAFLTDGSLMDR